MTVRTRLALTFAAVLLLAGAGLIALTVALAQHSIHQASSTNAPAEHNLKSSIANILNSASTSSPGAKGAAASAVAALKQKVLNANHSYSQSTGSAAVHRLLLWSVIGGAILVPAAALLGWLVAGRALRPVRAVTAAARRVSDNQLSERINAVGPRDEITELATTFDAMMERLEHAFDAQRRFVANASHELRTPLAVAGTAVDVVLAKDARSPEQLEAMARDVRAAVTRADEVVDSLLTLTRSQHLDHRYDDVDLATLVEDALDSRRTAVAANRLTLRTELEEARLVGDRALLERLVGNLVDNALQHNVPDGTVTVRTGVRDGHAELVVANTGHLIAGDTVSSLFEPFTRASGRARSEDAGLGLGLTIVRAVADAHRAHLHAVALPAGGLQVSVAFAC
jgi:signal transduction histidine kinase